MNLIVHSDVVNAKILAKASTLKAKAFKCTTSAEIKIYSRSDIFIHFA